MHWLAFWAHNLLLDHDLDVSPLLPPPLQLTLAVDRSVISCNHCSTQPHANIPKESSRTALLIRLDNRAYGASWLRLLRCPFRPDPLAGQLGMRFPVCSLLLLLFHATNLQNFLSPGLMPSRSGFAQHPISFRLQDL